MLNIKQYFTKSQITLVPFNQWDVVALLIIFSTLVALALVAKQMMVPYHLGETITISLDPAYLPGYALRTVIRIFIALLCSFLFTFTVGTLAAKSRHAERLIIPLIDILQSVPVLGFQAVAVVPFINLFHGSLLGPECAAIFAIFTAQAWNMTLSFYQSLKTIPHDLVEACHILHLSGWKRFWRLEVPFSMPGLLWNTMISMSASWFFVVAAEAISAANQNISLPGIGSYIALAIQEANSSAIFYAIIAMLIVILIYDQLLFRPLITWAEKFKMDVDGSQLTTSKNWLLRILQRTKALQKLSHKVLKISDGIIFKFTFKRRRHTKNHFVLHHKFFVWLWYALITSILIFLSYYLIIFITASVTFAEIHKVFYLGFLTALRVGAVILFCTVVWVPLGVWIGMRPKIANIAQPIMQFLAAFPANLLFPLVVYFILTYHLNIQIWVTALMIIGTQWYVAFNVIAGTIAIPKDLFYVSENFEVSGILKWQKLFLPAIFPYYVTGCITAMGGAWNMSIVAEVIQWGNETLRASGLGAYITYNTHSGDFARIALGITVMCIYVLIINRVIWRPLYVLAEKRFKLD